MKILVDGKESNVLVKVSKDRKCAASIDIVDTTEAPLAKLSFGDLDNPEVDVEVDFTFEQLTELMQTVMLGYNELEMAIKSLDAKEKAKKEAAKEKRHRQTAHMGSC